MMEAQYKIQVAPEYERLDCIKKGLEHPLDYFRFHYFRATEYRLPVVQVPIGFPVYNIKNYRTQDTQLSKVARNEFPTGFFDNSRQEDEEVQQAQHSILSRYAKSGKGEGVVPIWDELANKAEQTDYLLITTNGVVINGNRRLCAMRELYNSGNYDQFGYTKCMVLPDTATEDEILEVEVKLQMALETKLPYSWINTARACREFRDKGRGSKQIESLMNMDEKAIDREIAKLEYAELYLAEWLQKPNDYDQLNKTEQAFTQVATRNASKGKSAQHQEITKAFDFFLIENREMLEDRAYAYINIIEGNAKTFFEKFADTMSITLQELEPIESDQLEIDMGDTGIPGDKDYRSLINVIKEAREDEQKSLETLDQISEICDSINQQQKSKNKAALKFARDAYRKLISIDLSTAESASISELEQVLTAIQHKVGQLIFGLNGLK
jgi:hypothetical protein